MNPEVPFYVSKTGLRLFSPENAKNLAIMISKMCSEIGEPALIIIDTFSRNFVGNENSNQDTATFFNNIIGVGGHGCGNIFYPGVP